MSKFNPTDEQVAVVEAARLGETMKINAKAGAGKTSTLTLVSEVLAPRRGLYLAFNRAIANEAGAKMPGNVTAKTFHSLAYAARGTVFGERLKLRLNGGVVAHRLALASYRASRDLTLTGSALGGLAIRAVANFCRTLDDTLTAEHVPAPEIRGLDDPATLADIRHQVADPARRLWALMSDPKGDFPSSHDVYVKLWAGDRPRIRADFALFDEAQDADRLMLAVCTAQDMPIYYVGDPLQQIYSWRGAVNAMEQIKTEHEGILTMSFRFGQDIADVANLVTGHLGDLHPIRGNPTRDSSVGPAAEPDAILCRTNARVVAELFNLVRAGKTSVAATGVDQAIDFYKQSAQVKAGIRPSGALQLFTSWDELCDYTDSPEGSDLKTYITLANDHGIDVMLDMLQSVGDASKGSAAGADITISTAHRAKGLEWNTVKLASDFRTPSDKPDAKQPTDEELRLLYVAMTRARMRLDVSDIDLSGFDGAEHLSDDQAAVTQALPIELTPAPAPAGRKVFPGDADTKPPCTDRPIADNECLHCGKLLQQARDGLLGAFADNAFCSMSCAYGYAIRAAQSHDTRPAAYRRAA